jgi:hypothetical protein
MCFLFQRIKENLNPSSEHYRTAIVALGHVSYNLPDKYPVHIKNIVSRKVIMFKYHLCNLWVILYYIYFIVHSSLLGMHL